MLWHIVKCCPSEPGTLFVGSFYSSLNAGDSNCICKFQVPKLPFPKIPKVASSFFRKIGLGRYCPPGVRVSLA